jgi:hypothetical protein
VADVEQRCRDAVQRIRDRWPALPDRLARQLAHLLATASTARLRRVAVIGGDVLRPLICFDTLEPLYARSLRIAEAKRVPVLIGDTLRNQIFPQEIA